jgi:protoporphyrinogen/coproporphyrinogen III oxidase
LPSVIIIGGGISGLSAAYFLEQHARERGLQLQITLLEKSRRLGGVIQTEHVELAETGQRFLCEAGPDSLLTTKPAAIELCRKLGLADQLIPSNDALRKTYVLHRRALKPLPDGLMFVVPTKLRTLFSSSLLSAAGKLRLLLSPLLSPGVLRDSEDISVDQYVAQRFGREVVDLIAEPLLSAVYGADVRSMSVRAVLPQLLALEKQHGTLWRAFARQAAWGAPRESSHRHARGTGGASEMASTVFVTLREGMGQLPEKLCAALKTSRVMLGEATSYITKAAGGYQVFTDSTHRSCDAVIVATPAPVAAQLLERLDAALSAHLRTIVYRSVAIAAMGYRNIPPAPRAADWGRRGFGFVVRRSERRETIACTWVHNKFSHRVPPDAALLRSFFGGARNEAIDRMADDSVVATARKELEDVMGLEHSPDFHRIYRWPSCMPQYSVGHLELLTKIDSRLDETPGVKLAGNGYRGVGIPDCVQSAAEASRSICDLLRRRG